MAVTCTKLVIICFVNEVKNDTNFKVILLSEDHRFVLVAFRPALGSDSA